MRTIRAGTARAHARLAARIDNSAQWVQNQTSPANFSELWKGKEIIVEVTKALAALQPLYGKDNVEIVTVDGRRVRGIVRSMKTTQALTTPSVKMECANGELVKIPFPVIAEIRDLNPSERTMDGSGKQL